MKQMSYKLAGIALTGVMLTAGVARVSTQTTVPGIDKPVMVNRSVGDADVVRIAQQVVSPVSIHLAGD